MQMNLICARSQHHLGGIYPSGHPVVQGMYNLVLCSINHGIQVQVVITPGSSTKTLNISSNEV